MQQAKGHATMRATLSVSAGSTHVCSSVAQGSFLSPGSYTGVFREKDAFQMLPLPSSACSLSVFLLDTGDIVGNNVLMRCHAAYVGLLRAPVSPAMI